METRGGSPRDVSRIYGIAYGQVKAACRSGALVPGRIGRRSVLTWAAVERWIESKPPSGEFVAALGDQLEREVGAEAVDLREVLAEQREERCADIEDQRILLTGSMPTW